MRAYLTTAPRWILCLIYGLPFGAIMAIGTLSDDSSGALETIAFGLIAGILFGLCLTVATENQRGQLRALVSNIPASDVPTVFRTTRRGPAPTDPTLRAAALRVALYEAPQVRRAAIISIPFALLIIAGAISLRDDLPQLPALAALSIAGVAYQWYAHRQLTRQLTLLLEADHPS